MEKRVCIDFETLWCFLRLKFQDGCDHIKIGSSFAPAKGTMNPGLPSLGSPPIPCKSLDADNSLAVPPTSQTDGLRGTALRISIIRQ